MRTRSRKLYMSEVEQTLAEHADIITVHDLHIWSISSGLHALSSHIVVNDDMHISEASLLISTLEQRLQTLGISHVTIQVESSVHPHQSTDDVICKLSVPNASNETLSHHGHTH